MLVKLFVVFFVLKLVIASAPFDYIVVGAGGGGSVIANRLSANSSISVLLIDQGTDCSDCTALGASLQSNSVFQEELLPIEQSFTALLRQPTEVLFSAIGGTTKVFGCVYTRSTKQLLDDKFPIGYQYDDLLPYFKAIEDHFCYYLPESTTNISQANCTLYHGKGGDIAVAPQTFNQLAPITIDLVSYLNTTSIGYTPDYNNPGQRPGVAYETDWRLMANKSDDNSARSRVDSQIAFLPSVVQARPNLKIMRFTKVQKIIINPVTKRATGVQYLINGTIAGIALANSRVFVCAGVIGTPHLLHISGIGPADMLEAAGIPVLVNNPAIGATLLAHQAVILGYQTKEPVFHNSTQSSNNALDIFFNTGLTPSLPADIEVEVLEGQYVSSVESWADSVPVPYLQSILNGTVYYPFYGMEVENVAPTVLGSVTTVSPNVNLIPLVDLGWSIETFPYTVDFQILLTAINTVRSFMLNSSFAEDNILTELYPGTLYIEYCLQNNPNLTETELTLCNNEYLLFYSMTHFYHLTTSVPLGNATDLNAQVLGVSGLSVCDNSLLPWSTDGNPTVTLTAVCAKVAYDTLVLDGYIEG